MIILNVDMPKFCAECPCLDEEFSYCRALRRNKSKNSITDWYSTRPDFCPIKEVVECRECKWGFCNEIPNGESYMTFHECDLIKGVVPLNGYCVFGVRKVVQND